ncbi:MFS transporter small subunit [Haematomicrobium sanguinis]
MNARVKLVAVWVLVGVPLIYGIVQTLSRVPALFTG